MAGQRIDDHSFWAGGMNKDSPFPTETRTKHFTSAEGAGALNDYEDTTEKIKAQQEMGVRKAKSHMQKPLHRN